MWKLESACCTTLEKSSGKLEESRAARELSIALERSNHFDYAASFGHWEEGRREKGKKVHRFAKDHSIIADSNEFAR